MIREERERIIETLAMLPVNGATFGLIHYDVELDNLVWDDHTIHVLDFDDCQRCWYVADIAFALRDLFDDEASMNSPAVQTFVSGYVAHYPLDEDPFTHLPLFVRLANLLTYVQIVRAVDMVEDPSQPEWLNELIRKLRRRMDTYEQSLAAGGP